MSKCTKSDIPQYSDDDDEYETETNILCSNKPIDLKRVSGEPNHSQEDISCDWETSKLVKTKAFRIKDILGLDESKQFTKAPQSIQDAFTKASNTPSPAPRMFHFQFHQCYF